MYKDKIYIKNVSEDGKTATMLLNKRIGNAYDEDGNVSDWGVNGSEFANQLAYLKANGCEDIDVEINSIGGDVTQDGYDIVNAIIKHKVNTKVTGLALSMAAICALVGKNRSIVDYGSFMFHGVSPVNPENADGKILNIIQDSLKTIVQGTTRMNGDEIDNLFAKGKETWVSASKKADMSFNDAIEKGIIDCVIPTGKSYKALNTLKKDNLIKFYNSLNTNINQMTKTNEALKLNNEASDEARVEAITAIQTENSAIKAELETEKAKALELQNKLDAITKAENDAKTLAATNAVEKAEKEGKFKAEDKADMLALAITNLSAFEKLVAGKESPKKAMVINAGGGDNEADADVSKLTVYEYMKKHPKEFENRMKADANFSNQFKK